MKRLLTYRLVQLVLFLWIALFTAGATYAQDTRRTVENQILLSPENDYLKDTVYNKKGEVKDPDRVYNKLKESNSGLVRNVANIILVGGDTKLEADSTDQQIALSENYFKDYSGLVIDSIEIIRRNIFTPDDSLSTNSKAEQLIDKGHMMTRERVVRRYLLFKEGDKLDPLVMSSNEYLLRELSYIASAFIIIRPSDKGGVIASVFIRDQWTLLPWWETGDFPYIALYDENFLGTGNRAQISYLLEGDKQKSGWQFNYDFRNIFGTFIDAGLQLGIGGTRSMIGYIERKYNIPGDSYWNVFAGYTDKGERCLNYDTVVYPERMDFKAYYGQSFKLARDGLFTYFSAGGESRRFLQAPLRSFVFNPFYHDYVATLGNVGIAKQHFFQGNMIYGYGNVEDIAYGFKFELTGGLGYSPQTTNFQYYGAFARYSFYKEKFGYLDVGINGSIYHLVGNRTWNMGMVDFGLKYFSPLAKLGRGYYLRNFLYFSWTQGINRFVGERELLEYNSQKGVRGLYAPYWAYGTSRAFIRTESVLFSPIYLLHFRFCGFIWGDMAWLGDESMFWDNQISAAAGFGIRVKNDRLIINNIEIRFGIGIKTYPERGFSWFVLSDQKRLHTDDFSPKTAHMNAFE